MLYSVKMNANDPVFAAEDDGHMPDDLRHQISSLILDRAALLTSDTVAVFPFTGTETLEPEYCNRVGHLLVQLMAMAVREGRVDTRNGFITDLYRVGLERTLSAERLFTFVYLLERTIVDELAVSDDIGATSEPWPVVAQIVRRGSFDTLAAYTDRLQQEPAEAAIADRLTTLYTRVMLDAVLAKETAHAGRLGYPISLILFDVDHLSTINKEHGYGVGDRILERVGILIRTYFRQYDWVARYSEDSFAVLLSRTDPDNAAELAERVRSTVEERLGFTDHRNDRPVQVTVSAAVVNIAATVGDVIDPDRLTADAEAAIDRAKQQGRNRVERLDGHAVARRTSSGRA
jgi:diguanylate cyclase (GGDEF)-like protein